MSLHYKEYGDTSASLLVFIHGGGVSGWMWDHQIRHFANYHCLVPDLAEHGGSRGSLFSINESANQIAELIAEKGKDMMKKSFEDIVNSNPNCEGVILPKIGHGISLAKPELFNKLLEHWLMGQEAGILSHLNGGD